MKSVAVIGASLAGLSAARALRAQGFDGELTIVGAEARRPYDRPPLSKEFLAGDIGEDALALEADDDDLAAQWLLGRMLRDSPTSPFAAGNPLQPLRKNEKTNPSPTRSHLPPLRALGDSVVVPHRPARQCYQALPHMTRRNRPRNDASRRLTGGRVLANLIFSSLSPQTTPQL